MKDDGVGGVFQGLCILLVFFFILLAVASLFEEHTPVNVTETVVEKDIGHVHEFFSDDNQYNIYTTNNSFTVDLEDYNQIQVRDNLTVEYNTTFHPILYFKDREYYAT